jgi:hypothetical protein
MRWSLVVAISGAGALAACSEAAAPEAKAEVPLEVSAAAVPSPAPDGYVGVWAARPELCQGGAWRFERTRLQTAGEVSCDIVDVEPGAGGWALDVSCHAEGAAQPGRLTLTLDSTAERMSVEGGPFAESVTLARCNR